MLVAMARIQVVGLRSHLSATLDVLWRLKCLELIDANADADADSLTTPLSGEDLVRERTSLDALRTRIGALLESVPATMPGSSAGGTGVRGGLDAPPAAGHERQVDLAQVTAELDDLEPRIAEALRRIDELDAELAALPRYLDSLRRLVPVLPALAELEGHETVALLIDARHAEALETLRSDLQRELGGRIATVGDHWILGAPLVGDGGPGPTVRFEAVVERIDSDTLGVVLAYTRSASARIHSVLGHDHVTHVRLPGGFEDLDLRHAVGSIEVRVGAIPAEIEERRSEVHAILDPRLAGLRATRRALANRLGVLAATAKVAATESTFVLRGWAPDRDVDRIRTGLQAAVGDEVVVEELAASPDQEELAPTLLSNPGPARPFEFFVNFFALPRRRDLDPTLLMTAVMPALFGMMVGDVVYGLVLLALASLLRRRVRGGAALQGLGRFLQYGSLWAILFGFVYGEALGGLGQEFGMPVLWVYRGDPAALGPLITVSIAIGVVHVTLGLLLGLWTAWRGSDREALLTRGGTLVSLAGVSMVGGAAAGALPLPVLVGGIGSLVAGLVLLALPHGRIGILVAPIEVLAAVGNILSYLRIAAVGLAKAYLAIIANELAAAAPVLWLGILVGLLVHLLNLALAAFTPTIQALRLHYVEFFSKFYEGGGVPFRPYGSDDTATRVENEAR